MVHCLNRNSGTLHKSASISSVRLHHPGVHMRSFKSNFSCTL